MSPIDNTIVVTVCMVTYNHADFIKDSIEGVLLQKTNFRIELLIGEDQSTDNTFQICREYEQKYPDLITLVHDGQNHGMVANTQRLMDMAKGKYIAFSEGDDYWIDPLKLQKQVDILESNTQYAGCACQSRVIYGTNKENYKLLNVTDKLDRVFLLSDLLCTYAFQTSSFVFRTDIIRKVLPIPLKINGLDRIEYFLVASFGGVFWLKDEMAVYRKSAEGLSFNVTVKKLEGDLLMIPWFKAIIKGNFPYNALKAHIYIGIISIPNKIKLFPLLKYSYLAYYYAIRSELGCETFKITINAVLNYRLPKLIRRIFRKMRLIY